MPVVPVLRRSPLAGNGVRVPLVDRPKQATLGLYSGRYKHRREWKNAGPCILTAQRSFLLEAQASARPERVNKCPGFGSLDFQITCQRSPRRFRPHIAHGKE